MSFLSMVLRRPVTLVVGVLALILSAVFGLNRMAKDVFPPLNVPTIYVAQPFGGMDAAQMEGFLTFYYEYHFLYITGIEHVESKNIQGAAVMKLQFHPGTDMSQAMSETIGYVNRSRAMMPPGTVPPFVMRFDAGSVPIGQLVFASETRSVAQLQDAALNTVRPLFATLPGVSAPPPFGGSARTILVNLNPDRLRSTGVTPEEVAAALAGTNAILPAGNLVLGDQNLLVPINATVKNISVVRPPANEAAASTVDIAMEAIRDEESYSFTIEWHRHEYVPADLPIESLDLAHDTRGILVELVSMREHASAIPDLIPAEWAFEGGE